MSNFVFPSEGFALGSGFSPPTPQQLMTLSWPRDPDDYPSKKIPNKPLPNDPPDMSCDFVYGQGLKWTLTWPSGTREEIISAFSQACASANAVSNPLQSANISGANGKYKLVLQEMMGNPPQAAMVTPNG